MFSLKRIFLLFILTTSLSAETFHCHIQQDNSDPDLPGSIAYYLAISRPGDKVVLDQVGDFEIHQTLNIPPYVTLERSNQSEYIWIRASKSLDRNTMIFAADGATLKYLRVDAGRNASVLVYAGNTMDFTIDGGIYKNTKNNYPSGEEISSYAGIVINGAQNATLKDFSLSSIGCNPKLNPKDWTHVCRGIYAFQTSGCLFENISINYTLAGGIDLSGSQDVIIRGCQIENTGLANVYGTSGSQDGIIAYHVGTEKNFLIENCTVENYNNHGIHISGEDLKLRSNTIQQPSINGGLHAIYIGDWRDPNNTSWDIELNNNILQWGRNHENWDILKPIQSIHAPIRFENVAMDTVNFGYNIPNVDIEGRSLESIKDVELLNEINHAFICEFNNSFDSIITSQISNIGLGNNTFSGISSGEDPKLIRMDLINDRKRSENRSQVLATNKYSRILVNMAVSTESKSFVQVFWGTDLQPDFSDSKKLGQSLISDGEYHTYEFNLKDHPLWEGNLDQIRLDPMTGDIDIGKRFWVNWIRLGE